MSLPFIALRHGATEWNAEGRIQGRSDKPLSTAGRDQVEAWRLPEGWHGYRWITSPLQRAQETAALLGHGDAVVEIALIEANWGPWEGWTLDLLRNQHGTAMRDLEARGLDFRPPGGESPRDLQQRLSPLLARLAEEGQPTVAVCHKGVIRALYALASGWDMSDDPPTKLLNDCAQCFDLGPDGALTVTRLNRSLLG